MELNEQNNIINGLSDVSQSKSIINDGYNKLCQLDLTVENLK